MLQPLPPYQSEQDLLFIDAQAQRDHLRASLRSHLARMGTAPLALGTRAAIPPAPPCPGSTPFNDPTAHGLLGAGVGGSAFSRGTANGVGMGVGVGAMGVGNLGVNGVGLDTSLGGGATAIPGWNVTEFGLLSPASSTFSSLAAATYQPPGFQPQPLHERWMQETPGIGACPASLLAALMQHAERCSDPTFEGRPTSGALLAHLSSSASNVPAAGVRGSARKQLPAALAALLPTATQLRSGRWRPA